MMTFACQNPKAIGSLDFSPLLNQDLLTDWCYSNSRLELPMRYRSIMVDIRSPTQWVNCCHINNTSLDCVQCIVYYYETRTQNHHFHFLILLKMCNAALVIKIQSPLRVNPYKSENPLLCMRTISFTFIHCTRARYTQLARIIHRWIRAQWRWKETSRASTKTQNSAQRKGDMTELNCLATM